jgi:hypothetical protein
VERLPAPRRDLQARDRGRRALDVEAKKILSQARFLQLVEQVRCSEDSKLYLYENARAFQ